MTTFSIRSSEYRCALAFALYVFLFLFQPARAAFLDMSPEELSSHIDSCLHVVDSALVKCDIRAANKNISFTEYKIQKYDDIISKDNKKAYAAKMTALKAAALRLVDSLVQVNLTILRTKGRTEAIAFRQQCAARGLSDMQLVPIDDAIVDATSSNENAQAQEAEASSAAASEPQQRKAALDDILTSEIKFPEPKPAAPPPPQPEQPSARPPKSKPETRQPPPSYSPPAEPESKPSAIWPESASSSPTQAEFVPDAEPKQGKKVSAKIAELRADSVASVRDKARQSQLIKRQIQVLIEKRKGDSAMTCFMKNKPLLRDFLDSSSFSKLAAAALKASNDWLLIQAKAKADLRQIDSLMAAKRFEQARDRFNASKDTIRLSMSDDKRFFELKSRIMNAYDDLITNKKKAERSAKKINSSIDQKEGREAQAAFEQDAALLKEYLERATFTKLEAAVKKSCAEYDADVAAARKTAADIEGYLAKRRIELAYTTFKKSRGIFNRYLDEDTAVEALGKKVDKAFLEFRKHKKWAEDMIHELHWFIDHEKGDEAAAHLKKVRPELALYVETSVLSSLDSAATKAYNDFLAAKKLAEKNATQLRTLLRKKRCEEAFTLFQELKPSLEQYLADTAFAGVSNEVNSAYDELKDKKKRAEDFAGRLKSLVDDNKQKEARKEFMENRQTLKQYLDPKSFIDLEKSVLSSPKKAGKKET